MKLVVLLSGGIDSTVLLACMLHQGHECVAVSVDYGQDHFRELAAAKEIADHYNVEHVIIKTGVLNGHAISQNDSVVPARNLVIISLAVAVADTHYATAVAFGANNDDFNGFSDCRPEFIEALDEAVYRSGITCKSVLAPLINDTKKQVVELGKQLDAPLHLTWSCYRGGNQPCGQCGACNLREKAMA